MTTYSKDVRIEVGDTVKFEGVVTEVARGSSQHGDIIDVQCDNGKSLCMYSSRLTIVKKAEKPLAVGDRIRGKLNSAPGTIKAIFDNQCVVKFDQLSDPVINRLSDVERLS